MSTKKKFENLKKKLSRRVSRGVCKCMVNLKKKNDKKNSKIFLRKKKLSGRVSRGIHGKTARRFASVRCAVKEVCKCTVRKHEIWSIQIHFQNDMIHCSKLCLSKLNSVWYHNKWKIAISYYNQFHSRCVSLGVSYKLTTDSAVISYTYIYMWLHYSYETIGTMYIYLFIYISVSSGEWISAYTKFNAIWIWLILIKRKCISQCISHFINKYFFWYSDMKLYNIFAYIIMQTMT